MTGNQADIFDRQEFKRKPAGYWTERRILASTRRFESCHPNYAVSFPETAALDGSRAFPGAKTGRVECVQAELPAALAPVNSGRRRQRIDPSLSYR